LPGPVATRRGVQPGDQLTVGGAGGVEFFAAFLELSGELDNGLL